MNKGIPSKEEIKHFYSLGYSMKEIGEYLGYSVGKIHKYFHLYNIKPRNWGSNNEFAKIKISNSKKGKPAPNKNKKLSEVTKKKMSEAKTKKGVGHKKKRKDGYISVYFPDHPKSNKDGYIMEHDLIMECYIGRWLKEDEIVHHINRKRDDNRIENLKLMSKKEHARYHMLDRYNNGRSEDLSTKHF